jgi:ABC-type amino acid transport system permease subunit
MAVANQGAGTGGVPAERRRRKNVMERVIETLAGGLGNGVAWMAESGVLFLIFAVLWLAVVAGILWAQGSVDAAWQWIRGLPLIIQAVVWLLFLPVVAGMWVWETTWPLVVRAVLVAGIAGWNLLILLPRALQSGRP